VTIQTPSGDRPRPNNLAAPARDDAEYDHTCPDCVLCHQRGYSLGRTRGYLDAWQRFTGRPIPGADPVPEPTLVGWRDVLTKINTMLKRNAL
jgi:hypothetical protein